MTTLVIPSFERRLLRTVGDEIAAEPVREWPEQSLRLCLELLQRILESTSRMRRLLENVLAEGTEARAFARDCNPLLPVVDEQSATILELIDRLSPADDAASNSLGAALRSLERETRAYRELLARALSGASEAPRPVDWNHIRAVEEAHARGETTRFARRRRIKLVNGAS